MLHPLRQNIFSIWCLLKKDEDLIKNVLRRATKLTPGLYHKPYKERVVVIKVPSMSV